VGFDCILPRKRDILLAAADNRPIKTRSSTTHYDCKDLEAVGLLADDELSSLGTDLFMMLAGEDFTESPLSPDIE